MWLNGCVARRPKTVYPLPGKRRKRSGFLRWFGWLFVIAAIVAGAAFWWQPRSRPASPARVPPPAPAKAPARQWNRAEAASGGLPHPARDVFEAQVALARRGISPGVIDGALGSQTRMAIAVFQGIENLPQTEKLDPETRAKLTLDSPVLTNYVVTADDLARLQPLGKTWLAKSQQTALDYETILELVAEKSHSHPDLIRQLNPGINWAGPVAGLVVKVPDVAYPEPAAKAAFAVIHLDEKFLEAFDEQTNLLVHFPCSIAAHVEKRPVGELHVTVIAPNPNYTFDPALFPESPEAAQLGQKLMLRPGPRNPVGVAWIGLDKTGYGIHGTPNPEMIGRTESHGCFRLANWDAEYLSQLAWIGMPVVVEE